MKLNRTGNALNRNTRNRDNENWAKLEKKFNDLVGAITEEVFNKIIDGSKFDWINMVDTLDDLPSNPEEGTAVGVIENNTIYRYDGSEWIAIQKIDLNPIAEVDERLTQQLADIGDFIRFESMVNRKPLRRPAITVLDDDGDVGFYNKIFELAKEFNVPVTSAIITGDAMGFPGDVRPQNPKRYSFEQVMEMHQSGLVEFVSHTHTHKNLKTLLEENNTEEVIKELKESKVFLQKWGFNHRCVVYPFGGYNDDVINLSRQFYEYSTATGHSDDSVYRLVVPPIDNYRLGRYRATHSINAIEGAMDKAVAENAWIILVTHADQDGVGANHYREIFEKAIEKGLEFVTMEEGYNRFGNIAQFGSNSISADNQIFGNEIGRVVHDNSRDISSQLPIYYFKANATTFSKVSNFQLDGFPAKSPATSGILITHRTHEKEEEVIFNYQIFMTTREKQIYMRYWDNGWSDWENKGYRSFLDNNAVKHDDIPTNPKLFRKVTTCMITSSGNADFPESKSGYLTTFAMADDNFIMQEYMIIQESKTYRRWWDFDNKKWFDWYIVGGVDRHRIGNVTIDKLARDFNLGVTIDSIRTSQAQSEGWPDGRGGTLVTIKSEFEQYGAYTKQTYHPLRMHDYYTRYLNNDGSWSAWAVFRPTEIL